MTWYSDVDGLLTEGDAVNVLGPAGTDEMLALGPHTIELRVTDSQGAVASAFVDITVVPR